MSKFSQRSKDALKGVHPGLARVLNEAVLDTPIDFTIVKGVRTTAEQKALYQIGRRGIKGEAKVTDKDGVVRKSDHQPKADGYGHAVDLYPFVNGKVQADSSTYPALVKDLKVISAHILAHAKRLGVKITWGGNWPTLQDNPHFEI